MFQKSLVAVDRSCLDQCGDNVLNPANRCQKEVTTWQTRFSNRTEQNFPVYILESVSTIISKSWR